MLTVSAARAAMLAGVSPPPAEVVPLDRALGRTLAAPVVANRDQPPFAASAMDGYAVRRAELPGPWRIVGESAAGHAYAAPLRPGEAVRIFTGAPVPEGADCIVMQEDATRDGDTVRFTGATPGEHVRPRGLDFRAGAIMLPAGAVLDGIGLALAAATGAAALTVARRPRVALLSTGDEIVSPGEAPGPHQVFDSVTYGLAALIERWGGQAIRVRPVRDDLAATAEAAAAALADADLLVCVGGASVGDHDLVKPALAMLGLTLSVDTVAVRPGKPTWFGVTPAGLVLGLPGNPASALVCARLFLSPLLAAKAGRDPAPESATVTARLTEPLPANGPREHYLRARLSVDDQATMQVRPFERQDSSLLSVFAGANALLRRPAHEDARQAGAIVEVLKF